MNFFLIHLNVDSILPHCKSVCDCLVEDWQINRISFTNLIIYNLIYKKYQFKYLMAKMISNITMTIISIKIHL